MTPELKTKILSATRGTKLGAILRCAMGMNELGVAPRFVGKASVTSDSFIMCDLIDSDGNGHHLRFANDRDDVQSMCGQELGAPLENLLNR